MGHYKSPVILQADQIADETKAECRATPIWSLYPLA